MRDRRVRFAFVALILSIPVLIEAFSAPVADRGKDQGQKPTMLARAAVALGGSWRVQAVQVVLLAGLTFAGKERTRLEAERAALA